MLRSSSANFIKILMGDPGYFGVVQIFVQMDNGRSILNCSIL